MRLRSAGDLKPVESERKVVVSVGPLVHREGSDAELPAFAAELIRTTTAISCRVTVALPGRGIHYRVALAAS